MTREEFINSDEYVIANVELIVKSHKTILKTRDELNKFFLELRDELLLYAQQPNSDSQPQLQQPLVSGSLELREQELNRLNAARHAQSENELHYL